MFFCFFSDTDECDNGEAECFTDPNAICENQPGTYACSCRNGFELNSTTGLCEGMCILLSHICFLKSLLFYTCFLLYFNFFYLPDVDECNVPDDENPCGDPSTANNTCINSFGSYICFCQAGYEGDGLICFGKSIVILPGRVKT